MFINAVAFNRVLSGSAERVRGRLFAVARRRSGTFCLPNAHLHSRGNTRLQSVAGRFELPGEAGNHAANSRQVESKRVALK